jgi:hypothetical protein
MSNLFNNEVEVNQPAVETKELETNKIMTNNDQQEETNTNKDKKMNKITNVAANDQAKWFPLEFITSNKINPREITTTSLIKLGYGVFEPLEGSDKPALVALARGTDEEKQTFLKLVDHKEHGDTELLSLARSLRTEGQNSPITVIKMEEGRYEIEAGCRRFLGMLYNSVKFPEMTVRIKAVDVTGKGNHLVRAFSENFHRKDMNPVEQAHGLKAIIDQDLAQQTGPKKKKLTMAQLQEITSIDSQTCRLRLELLKLENDKTHELQIRKDGKIVKVTMTGHEVLAAVANGSLPVARAQELTKPEAKADPVKPQTVPGERSRMPGSVEATTMYRTKEVDDVWTEQVRKWVAVTLGMEYNDFPTTVKMIKDAEEKAIKDKEDAKAAKKAAKETPETATV